MAEGNEVRWGILATGRITQQFASDFSRVSNGVVTAVAARRMEAAEKFAATWGIPSAYGSYEAMLEDPQIDAVYIATPHTLHARNSIDAVQAGKHVLCEKPFAISRAEAGEVFRVAEGSDRFVMEGMWTYFLPAIQKALSWVEEGRIGKPLQIKADFGYPQLPYDPKRREYDADLAGGCLLEMGIYPVALAWLFMQRDPERIQVSAHRAPNGVEDDLNILYDYDSASGDARAVLGTSFRSKLRNWAYIIGEDSYIAIPDFWRASECFLYRLDECIEHFEDKRDTFGFDFEVTAAGEDILSGRQQSQVMPWSNTLRFQDHMERIRDRFPG